ncbi:hypothetical protein BKA64DRAFT_458118 [Cadophora sp. MPI-SDFR-AT-0126]|nr:hypothetical protein BKA64DRAFT_458118 [Leotiomycetes sp. MPI-SDFR-AT-0126]
MVRLMYLFMSLSDFRGILSCDRDDFTPCFIRPAKLPRTSFRACIPPYSQPLKGIVMYSISPLSFCYFGSKHRLPLPSLIFRTRGSQGQGQNSLLLLPAEPEPPKIPSSAGPLLRRISDLALWVYISPLPFYWVSSYGSRSCSWIGYSRICKPE